MIKTNILIKFGEDWVKTVETRVLTRFDSDLTSWPTFWPNLAHVWIWPRFYQYNILSKFEKNWVKTVAARVLTTNLLTDARRTMHDAGRTFKDHKSSPWALLRWAKKLTPHNAQRTMDITRSQKLTLSFAQVSLKSRGIVIILVSSVEAQSL